MNNHGPNDSQRQNDDRAQFEETKRGHALALGRDRRLAAKAVRLRIAADKYAYSYLWSWLGVPIIQLPADIVAMQEIIWGTKPDVIIETGIARGGSVLFLASLLELIGKGKVVGVDIDIRAHNRDTIERHPMARRVVLIEGPSTAPDVIARVKAEVPSTASVMVVLDSDHSRDHVLDELRLYGPMVTGGCYLIVQDTGLGQLDEESTPRDRSKIWLKGDDPSAALEAYLAETDCFELDEIVNGKLLLSSSTGGYLYRRAK